MKLKTKLIVSTLVLTAVSIGVIGGVANYIAETNAVSAINSLTKEKLVSTLEAKKSHIEQYLTNLTSQTQLMGLEQNTISAITHFTTSFEDFTAYAGLTPEMKTAVTNYYKDQFVSAYNQKNTDAAPSVDEYFKGFGDNNWLVQYHYIVNNPNPVGEKSKLDAPTKDFSAYSNAHKSYQESFREYAEKLGYGDIYFIDSTGNVAYSLNKGFELGTSVVDGPFANSGLGRVFEKAKTLQKGEVVIEDFSPYAPLLGEPAAFMASSLVKFKRLRGVFVVQLPINKVDAIMTNNKEWKKIGLGDSGETYLIGPDFTLRNTARLQHENPEGYFAALTEFADTNPQPIDKIKASGTSIGLQKVITPSTQAALDGQSGFDVIKQFDGRSVLSAYSTIDVDGFDWAIVSEIDYDEAFSKATSLANELHISLATIALVVLAASAAVVFLLAANIFKPLQRITERMHDIANGESNLKQRLDDSGDNEIADFASGFNSFISQLDYLVEKVAQTSSHLANQSHGLIELSKQGKDTSLKQETVMQHVVESVHDVASNIDQNTEYANATSEEAVEAYEKAEAGQTATQQALVALQAAIDEVNLTAQALTELESDSKAIASVLSVINDISDQTNLLALNAAIEAARAGESGRGFAVVADEVRSLSHRIQTETGTISETIAKLQKTTGDAVSIMQRSINKSNDGITLASEAGNVLGTVVDSSRKINDMNEKIAHVAQQQNTIILSINEQIDQANTITEASTQASVEIDNIGNDIAALAQEMQSLVAQFDSSKKH